VPVATGVEEEDVGVACTDERMEEGVACADVGRTDVTMTEVGVATPADEVFDDLVLVVFDLVVLVLEEVWEMAVALGVASIEVVSSHSSSSPALSSPSSSGHSSSALLEVSSLFRQLEYHSF
jgi:hypothetical protein